MLKLRDGRPENRRGLALNCVSSFPSNSVYWIKPRILLTMPSILGIVVRHLFPGEREGPPPL